MCLALIFKGSEGHGRERVGLAPPGDSSTVASDCIGECVGSCLLLEIHELPP